MGSGRGAMSAQKNPQGSEPKKKKLLEGIEREKYLSRLRSFDLPSRQINDLLQKANSIKN